MNIAVIFAGGAGTRMNSREIPKQFLELFQKPIIIHTLEHFENNKDIDAIVISCIKEWTNYLKELIKKYHLAKVKMIVSGGETGQLSIYNGLLGAKTIATENHAFEETIVLIHDGVRPMITEELISRNIESVKRNGTAITTGFVTETIMECDNKDWSIVRVPERDVSRVAKAPQSFWLKDILEAHGKAINDGRTDFIDSCTLMKHYGYPLTLVDGPSQNIKITTQEDFYMMRAMLEARENEQLYALSEVKG